MTFELKKRKNREFIPASEIKEVLDGELLMEVKAEETKRNYGLRLINKIKQELRLE